jgi:O-antigen/teichoic acid export membrane protein
VASGWTFFGFGFALLLRFGSSLVLTRLLVPEVFGVMAVCSAIQVIVTLIGDIGLKQAVIQSKRGHDPAFLNTAWTIQILRGLTIWMGCVAVAFVLHLLNSIGTFPANSVYTNSTLPILIAVISLSTPLQSLWSMKAISHTRELDLWRITIIELVSALSGFSVALTTAWVTHSIWSFAASSLAAALVSTLMTHFWLPGHRDRLAWDKDAIRELARFGKWSSLSSLLGVVASNSDRLMLGAWLTAASLGQYSIALNLASVIDGIGQRVFGNVSLPALSETVRRDPDRLGDVVFRMRRLADAAYVGSAGALFASGEVIIEALYDPRYFAAGRMLQILSFSLLFARYNLLQDAYIALGKPNYLTAINLVKTVSLFTIVPSLVFFFGETGAIVGMAIYLLPTVPLILWLNHELRLNRFRFELLVLIAWPIGWFLGRGAVSVIELTGCLLSVCG